MKRPSPLRQSTRPIALEVDTRSWLSRLSHHAGRHVRLGDVPDQALDELLASGCDAVWLMGVWRTGPAGRRIARSRADIVRRASEVLPDFAMADVVGSPYGVRDYVVARELGGESGLAALRERMARSGVALILDYVPNHTAVDHHWVRSHPDWYVPGSAEDAAAEPDAWFSVRTGGRTAWLAHGRDPHFPAWLDTAQLDYRIPEVREAMADVLRQVALQCDGVRCDMAMLVLDDVFRGTWADNGAAPERAASNGEFWWQAIREVRHRFPDFVTIAEAYWGLEYRLQGLGFDYTYDKTLLDRLAHGSGESVVAHLRADPDYQRHSVRFLENHDEERAATALSAARQRSAALVAATVPGMLLLHEGQLDGARISTPVEVARRTEEPPDESLRSFYHQLLTAVGSEPFRLGTPIRLEPRATWEGDPSYRAFTAWLWMGPHRALRLAVANLGADTGRCFVPLPLPDLVGRNIAFEDLLSEARYERAGSDLLERGLFLELPPDGYHLFRILGHSVVRVAAEPGDGSRPRRQQEQYPAHAHTVRSERSLIAQGFT